MTDKKLLMGNEAIAFGAIEAGVQVVTGYPGTPSTEALETVARYAGRYGVYTEWSSNEKVALETAIGAAYSGARALVTMKQVGLNVASDPLMSLSYIGVKGALVLLVADDPGPHSSQTEQDTRTFGHYANIPVLDPATPQEAYELTKLAFELSHEFETPVILRTTTRVSHSCGDVELADNGPEFTEKGSTESGISETGISEHSPVKASVNTSFEGFVKDRRWTIFPRLTAERHPWLENLQVQLSDRFSGLFYNSFSGKGEKIGIIASGVSALYVKEAIKGFEELFTFFRVGTVYPFPEKTVLSFLEGIEKLIVVEELDPYLEEQALQLIGRAHLPVGVYGKKNGFFPVSGEYNVDTVIDGVNRALAELGETSRLSHASPAVLREELPPLPVRAPTLCAGCMHRTVFYAFKQAAKQLKKDTQVETIFSGDIGCYTLGNAHPLNMVDTCLCMGAGMSIAGGLSRTNHEAKQVAFIGDSTFFHSGIPAVINAVYNGADVTLAVLDNRTTAMTGHQPHPGIGITVLGSTSKAIDIADVVRSCGVEFVKSVDIDSLENCLEGCMEAAKEAVEFRGPSAIVFKGKCAGITKSGTRFAIDFDSCTGCGLCIKQLGCPALFLPSGEEKPVIQDSCSGCGLCAHVCPSGAIRKGGVKQ